MQPGTGAPAYRALTLDDVAATAAMHTRAEAFDGVPRVLDVEELEEELTGPYVAMETDTRAAFLDGRIVGYAYTYYLPSEVKEERCYVFGTVDPDHRGAGIGTELVRWAIDRATAQLGTSDRTLPRFIRIEAAEDVTSAHELFGTFGFERVRCEEELLRPLTDLPDVRQPDGVSIAAWPDDRDEDIRHEKNLAFESHWGSTPTGAAGWTQLVRGFGSRPDLSFIAIDDATNEVVGHCLAHRYPSDDDLLGRSDGWIVNLGTVPAWQGRGIASALVGRALHAFADAALTHASIGVDSENPSGAAQLYRNLGFELNHRSFTHQIEL